MNDKQQIFYRGVLKSCNYKCEYCPFSKHISLKELEEDKLALERFVDFVEKEELNIGAVLFVPYGEALIHEHYWYGMARISKIKGIEAIGCQTNLSFDIEQMVAVFREAGGDISKLKLWCSFHPSMVTLDNFAEQCRRLSEKDISYCVGAVGVPKYMEVLKELRGKLADSVYFWVNPMDGLKRPYMKSEIEEFVKIDSMFQDNLRHKKSKPYACKGCNGGAMFINAKGDVTPCNISRKKLGNIYDGTYQEDEKRKIEHCGQKECSCFLAYSNRLDCKELEVYGKYPAFRMADYFIV